MHLAATDVEVDLIERESGGEMLDDARHHEKGRRLAGHRPLCNLHDHPSGPAILRVRSRFDRNCPVGIRALILRSAEGASRRACPEPVEGTWAPSRASEHPSGPFACGKGRLRMRAAPAGPRALMPSRGAEGAPRRPGPSLSRNGRRNRRSCSAVTLARLSGRDALGEATSSAPYLNSQDFEVVLLVVVARNERVLVASFGMNVLLGDEERRLDEAARRVVMRKRGSTRRPLARPAIRSAPTRSPPDTGRPCGCDRRPKRLPSAPISFTWSGLDAAKAQHRNRKVPIVVADRGGVRGEARSAEPSSWSIASCRCAASEAGEFA